MFHGFREKRKLVTKESSGERDSAIRHVRTTARENYIKSFYINRFFLKTVSLITQLKKHRPLSQTVTKFEFEKSLKSFQKLHYHVEL